MQKHKTDTDSKSMHIEHRQMSREEHLQIINDFGMQLLYKTTINEIVWLIAKSVIAQMGFVDCVVYLIDESGQHLIQKAAHGFKNPVDETILNPISIEVGKGIVGTVAKTGIPELIHDTSKDDRYIVDDSQRLSEIAVPIIYENEVIGVIDCEHPEANAFNSADITTLSTIASMSSIKIIHAKTLVDLQNHKANLEKQIEIRTKELTSTITSLEKSNQDLESFAYAASHDMQEPLRTVVSYLQLLEHNEKSLSESSKEFLGYAVDGSKRMKNLLDGLLEYSRVKSSSAAFKLINLDDLMILVKADLQVSIRENDTIFKYENLPTVFGNKTQIQQLFQNLISNAIKFQKPDQQAIIEITAEEKDAFLEIRIKDNGLGIAAHFHDKIFGLFKRLNANRDYKGSGIGLSLCKRIVEYHNGKISVESEVGEGTTFIFTLPKGEEV